MIPAFSNSAVKAARAAARSLLVPQLLGHVVELVRFVHDYRFEFGRSRLV